MVRNISEADTRVNFIDPKLIDSDWTSENIEREFYFIDGRKLLGNRRGERLFLGCFFKYNICKLGESFCCQQQYLLVSLLNKLKKGKLKNGKNRNIFNHISQYNKIKWL